MSTIGKIELQTDDEIDQALQRTFNLLSYRLRSVKEIELYLKDKGYCDDVTCAVISRLHELDYVNDLKFAESYVRNEMKISRKGPIVIRQMLQQKGVSSTDCDCALQLYPESDQLENIIFHGEKLLRKYRHLHGFALSQKLNAALYRKGYSGDLIQQFLKQEGIIT